MAPALPLTRDGAAPHAPVHPPGEPSPARLPAWVGVVDTLIVVTAVLTACLFVFGGFREYVSGIRISFRSWHRLGAVALLLIATRHYFVRTPTTAHVLGSWLRRCWGAESGRAVWPVFLSTRVAVLLAGYLAVATIGIAPKSERFRVYDNELLNLPARWDAGWYLSIVTEGYTWNGNPQRQQNVVFFPAFPLMVRAVGLFLGKHWLHVALAVATTAFFFALVYLHRLARDLLEPGQASMALWALATYPFSVYYSAPYTEGLYLLGSVAAFYHSMRGQWGRAAAWGFFLGLCRPNGFFIAGPLGILVLQRALRERRLSLASLAPVVTPVIGMLSYCAYLYVRFGDPFLWTKGQVAWGRVFAGIWPGVQALFMDRYEFISDSSFYRYSLEQPYDLLHTLAAIFVLLSIWPTIRRFGLAYGAFTAVNILPPLIVGGMMSIGRMTSVLFPAFLWVAAALPERHRTAWIAASCVLQGLIAVLFFTWRPAF